MSVSSKTYIQVAELLAYRRLAARGNGSRQVTHITAGLADIFEKDNPQFDRERFYNAIGVRTDELEAVNLPDPRFPEVKK
jgi:hypothetical protein